MVRNFCPIWIMLFYVFICDIKVKHSGIVFIILSCLIFSFLHIGSLLFPYAYVSVKLIDCILLSSFELEAILSISWVKRLCLSLLNLCYDFNIRLFFINPFLRKCTSSFIFSSCQFYYIFHWRCPLTVIVISKFKFSFYDTFVPFAFLHSSSLSFK